MRILVVGAGKVGAEVLLQLQKNATVEVLTLDPRPNPFALEQGIISAIDFRESLTPLNLDYVLAQAKPDLILLARATEDFGMGQTAGMGVLAESISHELVEICPVPIIKASRN